MALPLLEIWIVVILPCRIVVSPGMELICTSIDENGEVEIPMDTGEYPGIYQGTIVSHNLLKVFEALVFYEVDCMYLCT